MIGSLGSADEASATVARAVSLLSAVSDKAAAKLLLDQVASALDEMKQRQADAERAEAANGERLRDLLSTEKTQQARQMKLDSISADLAAHQQRLDASVAAASEREKALSAREAAASALESKLAADNKAFSALVERHRRALG